MLTLRQIEIVRAIMVSGSLAGAARLLNVSQPGISRAMKHIQANIGIQLFVRQAGRYVPSKEATRVFDQINEVHRKVDDLNVSIGNLERGRSAELRVGSVPSIANAMVPRAILSMNRRYRELEMNIEILKIEEAIDYLILGRGELVSMSYRLEHPALVFEKLATGRLVFVASPDHPAAGRSTISAREIARFPLIGIDPSDPYGRIMASLFARGGVDYATPIKARFATTVLSLVRENAGVAVLDIFSVQDIPRDTVRIIPIEENTDFDTYIAYRRDAVISSFARAYVDELREIMKAAVLPAAL